ncbi:unnamed protein product [Phytomonas sp. EM1]|nr:unnamed protein product [Phytomonas sp. EM1]|eukprot:CCW63909.1 unnamed protein product [Phytomonas sp. isolate EM1]
MASFFDKPSLTLLKGQSLTPISEAEALEGKKYILVYFSAHWCPPCRVFTPKLRTFYDKCHKEKNFEVVFVSLDKTVGGMRAYMESAHGNWLALPLDQAKVIEKEWMEKYDFQSIPALFIFENAPTEEGGEDKKGRKLVTRYGRDMLEGDPTGENFPWPNGDAEIQEHYRVLKRNLIFVTLFSIALGLWLFRLYVNIMSRNLKK